ncbi:MAG: HEAT repeat domain-containing protein [Elusimicrobia bacterium]|jgi:tetratricopeptide (TPR) repeat protein|nr:HEAT repeat domain-containing protein [Elusimicrobiota bacterium]
MRVKNYIIKSLTLAVVSFIFLTLPARAENDAYREGVNHYLDGNIVDALESLEKAYKEALGNKDIRSLYSEVMVLRAGEYFEKKEYEEAFRIIKRAKKIKPNDPEIGKIYNLIDNKLNPDKVSIKSPKESEDVFTDIKEEKEQKREERIKIIKEPPERLTVKERELLRPIIIGASSGKDNNYIIYLIGGAFLMLLIFAVVSVYFIKQLVASNRESLEELSEASGEKVRKMETEIKKLRRVKEKNIAEERKKEKMVSVNTRIDREKIKNEYAKLLEQSLKSKSRAPQTKTEPKISAELLPDNGPNNGPNKNKEAEIKGAFRKLKKINYNNAIKLLKKFIKDKNPWIKLWAAELASEIKPEDAVNLLKGLLSSDEYQVKKRALKTLRGFLDSKNTAISVKNEIENLIDSTRKDGWVV